jgi:hypothetical protein
VHKSKNLETSNLSNHYGKKKNYSSTSCADLFCLSTLIPQLFPDPASYPWKKGDFSPRGKAADIRKWSLNFAL